jgi:peroxiredoxin
MPWFEEFYAKYKPQGLVVLGLSQDDTDMPRSELAAAAKKIGVTYPILMPDDKIAKVYSLADYLPETFYLDKNGIVVEHTLGTPSKDELEAHVLKAMGQ